MMSPVTAFAVCSIYLLLLLFNVLFQNNIIVVFFFGIVVVCFFVDTLHSSIHLLFIISFTTVVLAIPREEIFGLFTISDSLFFLLSCVIPKRPA